MYDFLLFVHVLAAFSLLAMVVMYSAFAFGGPAPQRAVSVAFALDAIGGVGTLIFGVWLALYVDGYELWDAWIIIAIVLWFVGSGAGGRLGAGVREGKPVQAMDGSRVMVAVMAVATLLLLLDMIFKPWA